MQGITYSVDLALCVDATGSMGGIIERVKGNTLRFYEDLSRIMEEKSKAIDSLRIKVIVYRDYFADGNQAMSESPFFRLPDEKEAFSVFVRGVTAQGGGDEPENGLEAVALAMKSDWVTTGNRRRQLIVVWTDASAHPLEKGAAARLTNYPGDLPATFGDLTDLWEGQHPMSPSAKRIIVFGPDAHPWTDIANHWDNSVHFPSRAGEGLSDVDYNSILDAIANSV